MSEASILDVLTETEQWLDLHKFFGPLSGFEAKIDDPRKRFIKTLFCYGCNLGTVQTARSVKGLSGKRITAGAGAMFSCNAQKNKYRYCGIGMVDWKSVSIWHERFSTWRRKNTIFA